MKMYKIAYTTEQNRKKIDENERKIVDLKSDLKSLEREVKNISKQIDEINLGARRFWQQKTVFTTIERKLERFDKLEKEWNKYKEEIDEAIKRVIEKKDKASIK